MSIPQFEHEMEQGLEWVGQEAFQFVGHEFGSHTDKVEVEIDERDPLEIRPEAIAVRLPLGNHLRTKTVVLGQGIPLRVLYVNPYRIGLFLATNAVGAVIGVAETAVELAANATDIIGGFRVPNTVVSWDYTGDLWAMSINDSGNNHILYVAELVASPQ